MPIRGALAIRIDRGLIGVMPPMGADDRVVLEQFGDPVPVIQQLVIHGVPPVPGTQWITRAEDVFGHPFGVGVERSLGRIGGDYLLQKLQERGVLP